jgi:hypothetical protein
VTILALSWSFDRIDWSIVREYSFEYGVKGATSLAIPRPWIPPFVLLSVGAAKSIAAGAPISRFVDLDAITPLLEGAEQFIVRSSVVGETIWERGTYTSVKVDAIDDVMTKLDSAARAVLKATEGKVAGLMLQRYVQPRTEGEFGNLLRISKTRDHWEISTRSAGETISHQRLNAQRDQAADPSKQLLARAGLSRERLFASIGAWINNELLLQGERCNCEWINDGIQFFIVQIDEEAEDRTGANPFQIRVPATAQPAAKSGRYLTVADKSSLGKWDKLKVLEQLWEAEAVHRPVLFCLPISDLRDTTATSQKLLEADFLELIGEAGIHRNATDRTNARSGLRVDQTKGLPGNIDLRSTEPGDFSAPAAGEGDCANRQDVLSCRSGVLRSDQGLGQLLEAVGIKTRLACSIGGQCDPESRIR